MFQTTGDRKIILRNNLDDKNTLDIEEYSGC